MKNTKGKITISKVDSNLEDDYISITISDRLSGKQVVKGRMTLEDFAKSITGQGSIDIGLEVFNNYDTLGKKVEVKSVPIPYKLVFEEGYDFQEDMKEKAKEFEVDGWVFEPERYNHHRANGVMYQCSFRRFVEVQ